MGLRIVVLLAALIVGALSFRVLDQGRHIDRLDGELKMLRASVQARADRAVPIAASPIYAPVTRPTPEPDIEPTQAVELPGAPPPAEARVPVTHDEVARVESAVLSLLDADRPELRAKLRAVVQEQQKTYEQEQREERRERWATRREALLLELGKEVGLTNEQRAEVLHLMLATRDQIGDTFQSAQTPEAINESREKARVLRQQTDAQIRELLKPAQYEAYRARFEEDDEAERRARGPRGERERTPP